MRYHLRGSLLLSLHKRMPAPPQHPQKPEEPFRIPFSWWPLITACLLVPMLCLVGGNDLGAYGENDAFRDFLVAAGWIGIPLGGFTSLACGAFIISQGRVREGLALWLCCLLGFPVYALIIIALFT